MSTTWAAATAAVIQTSPRRTRTIAQGYGSRGARSSSERRIGPYRDRGRRARRTRPMRQAQCPRATDDRARAGAEHRGMMRTTTRWVLAHRRLVALFWLLVVVAGIAFSGRATGALEQSFAVPDREGSTTNRAIESAFGTGGGTAPLVAVATLPAGTSRDDPAVARSVDALADTLRDAVPGTRVASDPQL